VSLNLARPVVSYWEDLENTQENLENSLGFK